MSIENARLFPALELVEDVLARHGNAGEGKLVRSLAEEIRSKKYYLLELELVSHGLLG